MKKIGFIGLGIMGSGMAGSLIRKGFEVTVWNRDKEKFKPLARLGAKVAESVQDLAGNADVVVSMLRDDKVVKQILIEQAIPAARPGTTFIDMTTVTPMMVRQMVHTITAHGCHYLDAPVSGSKLAAENGQLNIMVGGSADMLEAQRDVLSAMGQNILHIGPHGSSAYIKLANNQLAAVMMAAIGEGLALTGSAGLDRKIVLETLVATASRVAGMKLPKILEKEWSTHFALELMVKDMTQALQAADELGVPMPVLAIARESYQRIRQQGKGELDFSVVTDPAL